MVLGAFGVLDLLFDLADVFTTNGFLHVLVHAPLGERLGRQIELLGALADRPVILPGDRLLEHRHMAIDLGPLGGLLS